MMNVVGVFYYIILSIIFFLKIFIIDVYASDKFFENSNLYRGFYWFEEDRSLSRKKLKKNDLTFETLSSDKAKQNIQSRKEELEKARNVMLELSFQNTSDEEIYKAVRYYKRLENEMQDSGIRLARAWDIVNFTDPGLIDRVNTPVNVPANKLRRLEERKYNIKQIQRFAEKFDLVLFEREECIYCKRFKTILQSLVSSYGFSLDIVNSEENLKLFERFSINFVPTLVAVSKDGKTAFELTRGLATMSELEENVIIAVSLIDAGYQFNLEKNYDS